MEASTSVPTASPSLNLELLSIVSCVSERKSRSCKNIMNFYECKLKLSCEKMVDFDSLKVNGIDIEEYFMDHGWEKYFKLLNGPIYPLLVTKFWMNAKVVDEKEAKEKEKRKVADNPSLKGKSRVEMGLKEFRETEIRSTLLGLDFVITQAHIAKLLEIEDKGEIMSHYKNNSVHLEAIRDELFEDKSQLGKAKAMFEKYIMIFKILLTSFFPRESSPDQISWEHKNFIYFLFKRTKINLASCLFDHLCDAIRASASNLAWAAHPRLKFWHVSTLMLSTMLQHCN
ncbi:hypothetical protein A2U01_0013566, partial [Trifolium medium]|nr:hypothetical protein [Trifolium medium]